MNNFNIKKNVRWSLDERLKLLMIIYLKDKNNNLLNYNSRIKINGKKKWIFIKNKWFDKRKTTQLRSHYQKAILPKTLNKYLNKFTNFQKLIILSEILINE